MTNKKNVLRNMVALVSKTMVKMANGTASMHYIYQPKKPSSLKNVDKK